MFEENMKWPYGNSQTTKIKWLSYLDAYNYENFFMFLLNTHKILLTTYMSLLIVHRLLHATHILASLQRDDMLSYVILFPNFAILLEFQIDT